MVGKWTKRIYLTIAYIFLYAPIIFLIVFSFNSGRNSSSWDGFSLKWYSSLFDNQRILKALYYTVIVAVISSVISTVLGTLSALGIDKMSGWRKKAILNINYLPVLNPDIF
jgi:spermidine/putrescine transport system permease protein